MQRREKITLLFWLFLSLFFCIESWRLGLGDFNAPGSGFLPFGASLAIGLLVIILFLKERGKKLTASPEPLFQGKRVRNIIYVLGSLFAYLFLLNKLGFFLCSLFFVGFCIKLVGTQKWSVILGISISVAIFSHLLFVVWLNILIPKGAWVGYLFSLISLLWK